ncbi:MAG: HEAT repeat domain-containing protein [Planctomycetota bacterium]
MLDQAFEALKTYDWGTDTKVLDPIEEAVVTTRDNADARKDLEKRLVATLKADVSRDAKDYVCRKLRVVGTAASVPALAEMLPQEENSHMARYALESMPVSEAAQALRDALPKVSGELKVGVIGSLGVRQDAASVPVLASLLEEGDESVARSAALALGAIRLPSAAKALNAAKTENAAVSAAIADASLACAEAMLEAGKKAQARRLYKGLSGDDRPKHVRLAATRGLLACAGE